MDREAKNNGWPLNGGKEEEACNAHDTSQIWPASKFGSLIWYKLVEAVLLVALNILNFETKMSWSRKRLSPCRILIRADLPTMVTHWGRSIGGNWRSFSRHVIGQYFYRLDLRR
jgi:hypothetical protein